MELLTLLIILNLFSSKLISYKIENTNLTSVESFDFLSDKSCNSPISSISLNIISFTVLIDLYFEFLACVGSFKKN